MTLQPSVRLRGGIYVSVNDHYDLSSGDREEALEQLQTILTTRWDDSGERAVQLATHFVDATVGLA